ncbi:MAG: undecaprenyl/decaprenyl-phosphate alpha-N-acetylglucosaminyl 1-phosphate transferase [Firmicutes bacterium]|nr:undecaprenyl/decaprenyl-phosphate alpha-N-acetylglucosaminyl 1-phosphate transferase [Bacillota bacterium]
MFQLILAFFTGFVVTLFSTPVVRRLSLKLDLVDRPNERRINLQPVPTGGGLALIAGFGAAALSLGRHEQGFAGIMLASVAIVLVGLVDDLYDLPPWLKLGGQVGAALLLAYTGTRIEFITNPLGGMIYLGGFSVLVTVLWVVSVTNMINLIDGLDGLAAGVSAIACVPLLVVALGKGQFGAALLTVALLGSALGFLRHNFHPARIFMGDTGSMFLGFSLAAITTGGALKGAAAIALTVPLVALGVPAFDVVFAVIRRFRSGVPVYVADRGHIHHRLLELGLSHRQAVLAMYAVSSLLGIGAIVMTLVGPEKGALLLGLIALGSLFSAYRLGLAGGGRTRDGKLQGLAGLPAHRKS